MTFWETVGAVIVGITIEGVCREFLRLLLVEALGGSKYDR